MLGRVKQKLGWHSFRLSGILLLMAVWLAGAVPAGANPEPEEASSQAGGAEEARPENFTSKGKEAAAQVMAAGGTNMAEGLSPCPVDMVPIQIVRWMTEDPVTTLSAARLISGEPSFNTFVTTVTEHLAAKLAQKKLCLSGAGSRKRSLVQFAYLRGGGISESDLPKLFAVRPLEARPADVCRIYSPWIDIAIEREPVPSVRAIVRFSERQLLADQAVLAGARNVPPGVVIPMRSHEFGRHISAYLESELFITPKRDEPLKKAEVEKLVPPDILWLLTHTPQPVTLPPFTRQPGVRYEIALEPPFSHRASLAMRDAIDWGAEGYTKIVMALIDQCFESDGADMRYNSVLDVAGLVPLEQYKIVMPFIERKRPVR